MTRRLLTLSLAAAACALLLQGCIAGAVVGAGLEVAGAGVKGAGAVASAIIPGESKKQRLARLDREDKARKKAAKAEKKRRQREEREARRDRD